MASVPSDRASFGQAAASDRRRLQRFGQGRGRPTPLWHGRARGSTAVAQRPGAAHGTPGGDNALMSGPSTVGEKLTGGIPR
jgi:hypothetical protein